MKTSIEGIRFLKKWEGTRLEVYKDAGGQDTIGVGHLILPGEIFSVITKEEAEALLKKDLVRFENAVNQGVTVSLSQNQFDALVSYAFNIGVNAFLSSNLLKLINGNAGEDAITQWWVNHYVTAGGVFVQGLQNRRIAEAEMYFSEKKNIITETTKDRIKTTAFALSVAGIIVLLMK